MEIESGPFCEMRKKFRVESRERTPVCVSGSLIFLPTLLFILFIYSVRSFVRSFFFVVVFILLRVYYLSVLYAMTYTALGT